MWVNLRNTILRISVEMDISEILTYLVYSINSRLPNKWAYNRLHTT